MAIYVRASRRAKAYVRGLGNATKIAKGKAIRARKLQSGLNVSDPQFGRLTLRAMHAKIGMVKGHKAKKSAKRKLNIYKEMYR